MGREKEDVRRFYETFGWKRRQGADYGEVTFNDLRAVTGAYNYGSNLRVRSALPKKAKVFLDAACGARPESVRWTQHWGIERKVCVDMSRVGLGEAGAKRGRA